MKFLCKTTDLQQALQLVARAISSQQALPILGNVLLEVEGKRAILSATDLELSMVTNFPAEVENEGSITIPAKAFLNFAQYTSDPEVLIETNEGTQLKCTSKRAKTLISGEAASEYPTITPIQKESTLSINTGPLLEALHLVTFAAAKTNLRPVLSGVYVCSEKGRLLLVATDSYRLSEYKLPITNNTTDISCIVPTKVLDELQAVLGAKKAHEIEDESEGGKGKEKDKPKKRKRADDVEISLSSQQIEVHSGPVQLLSRLIDGKFPDYQQIIPTAAKTKAIISIKDLLPTVRRMHYFAKEINNNLTFHFMKNDVRIITPQTQAGRDEAVLPIEGGSGENKIALSSSYLLDFLSHLPGEKLEISITDSQHPAIFRIPGKTELLHLIMPLRLQEE
jgi:DNA polymerase III subunit beta